MLGALSRIKYWVIYYLSKRSRRKYNFEYTLSSVINHYTETNDWYMYCHHYFWNLLPLEIKKHRKYFTLNQRGFGEDAFHAMWYLLFKEFRPNKILEIGVYRGQTLSLFSFLNKLNSNNCEIHGISPFTSSGDEVSIYLDNLDYYEDVIRNFKEFNLPIPYLHKGLSTDKEMIEVISSSTWDLIYIDGNHNYEVAKSDFENCAIALKKGGLLVMDDSALFNGYSPALFSTAGHFGPSKVVDEIDMTQFKEIISVGHNRVFMKI